MPDASDTLAGTTAPDNPVTMDPNAPDPSTPQNVPPAGGTSPVQEDPAAQFGGLIPSETAPRNPDVERDFHESKWRQILDRVGTILGGGETVHITKDGDGNIQEIHMPSSTSEKWGRVAAAALGGAAQGFANSRGPGGLGNATAAGVQYGMQIPKQIQDNADAQATAAQRRVMANASKAKVQQDIAMNAFAMRRNGIQLNEEQSDRANQNEQWILSNSNNKKVADFDNVDDAIKYENTHGDLLQGHTNGAFHTEIMGNGKVRLYTYDQAWADQKNDQPVSYKTLEAGDTPDADMTLKEHTIPVNGMTNREISTATEAATKRISDYQIAKDKENKPPAGTEESRFTTQYLSDNKLSDTAANRLKARRAWSDAGEKPPAMPLLYAPNAQGGYTPQRAQPGQALPQGTLTAGGMNTQSEGSAAFNQPTAPPASYQPGFAPAQNFEPGTPGITPKQIGKVPSDAAQAARLGRSVITNGNAAIKILQDHPDLVGRINGLGSKWQQTIGISKNDPLAQLQGYVDQMTIANLGAHKLRSAPLLYKQEEDATNHLRNDPSSIMSFIQARIASNQQFVDEDRRYRLYGDPVGPDQSLDKNRRQAATQPGGKGGVDWNKFPAAQ